MPTRGAGRIFLVSSFRGDVAPTVTGVGREYREGTADVAVLKAVAVEYARSAMRLEEAEGMLAGELRTMTDMGLCADNGSLLLLEEESERLPVGCVEAGGGVLFIGVGAGGWSILSTG